MKRKRPADYHRKQKLNRNVSGFKSSSLVSTSGFSIVITNSNGVPTVITSSNKSQNCESYQTVCESNRIVFRIWIDTWRWTESGWKSLTTRSSLDFNPLHRLFFFPLSLLHHSFLLLCDLITTLGCILGVAYFSYSGLRKMGSIENCWQLTYTASSSE